jgi:hypothetical protein
MNNKEYILGIALLGVIASLFMVIEFSTADNTVGLNYKNVTVRTTLNITNSRPEVTFIKIYQETNASVTNITLSGGLARNVTCNATIRDWNGYTDVWMVNATLHDVDNAVFSDPDNNNTHYTNTNCTNSGNGVNYTVNYICNFPVYYYANNGTWNCSVFVWDTLNSTGNRTNSTLFYPLYSLNVTEGINYGALSLEEYSLNMTANITNFGNRPINVSVESYGITRGDGLAMNCNLNSNISASNQKFSISDVGWDSKTAMSGAIQNITNLTLSKQTLATTPIVNLTYWQLFVNSTGNPAGNCTGYIIFSAETAS